MLPTSIAVAGAGASGTLPVAKHRLALGLMLASGFASLGYQIVWTQQTALWLGHEAPAVLAVVAAFFGGLALGSLLLGSRIERSARPWRWYAGCEVVIGVWSLALAFLPASVSSGFLDLIGAQPSPAWHWSVAFCGTFLLLLPATAAMGATLPAMERIVARVGHQGSPIAALYAGNTFGAVLGVLGAALVLVPALGLTRTAGICASLNFLCAAATVKLFAGQLDATPRAAGSQASGIPISLLVTGLLGIGYEVLVVRVLSQVAENTVYTFAILLAIYLVGTALGAAIYARLFNLHAAQALGDRLLRLLAVACLLGMLSLAGAMALKASVTGFLGGGMAAALVAEAVLATLAFLPPTVIMGALFSHLATHARIAGIGFGRALGVNTLGAAFAAPLFGVWVLPAVGPNAALLLVAAGYLALASRRAWSAPAQWATLAALVLMAVWAPSLAIVDVPEDGRLLSYRQGVMATVSVVQDSRGVASLHIDNRQQEGSSATLFADARQALLPSLLHPAPRHALFLGLGTGVTASAAAEDRQLQVDAVELLPDVIEASTHFRRMLRSPVDNPRLRLISADARRFVRTSRDRYDVIVSDNFHPARSGSGALYTVEHFASVRDRLAADGVFCQWLPLHQLDLDTLRSIVRSFMTVYPQGWAMLATNSLDTPVIGLVARRDTHGFDAGAVRARISSAALPRSPADFGIEDEFALLGSFVAGPRSLVRFAGNAPLNTDDRPVVVYRAPRITYAPDTTPRDRLIALLREIEIDADELLTGPRNPAWESRLALYWTARDRFLEVGRDVQLTADVRRMLAQVREPLLSILQISPDFSPAYDPLLRMAADLARTDAGAARVLLAEMARAQPSRPQAAQLLRELGAGSP
jgi:spermidine synthase